jgi:hypothetical protein
MAQALDKKTFPCFGCRKEIKLKRNDQDNGWIYYELDGQTLHDCPAKKERKNFTSTKTLEKVEQLESKIDLLLEEVRFLREELQKKK